MRILNNTSGSELETALIYSCSVKSPLDISLNALNANNLVNENL